MDSGDLKVFAAVARLGGMNRAAAALNTVQSNVTARIQQLEATLGVPLFHRHSRGVGLTDAGRRLLPYAERAALLLAEARRAVADDGTPKGGLAVGAMETTTALRLPAVLAAYAAAHPAVDLVLRTGTTCELTQAVLEHRLEGALVCGPVDHPELEARPAFREELVLVAARHLAGPDVLAGRPELKIIVFRAGCSYRQKLESLLAGRGVADPRRLEFGTLDGILGCVAAGVGVTLLPRGVVAA
ncbi:MAG TPA: LysR family transcriptional regulator, partial [Alphaproteobacteria bacterium]|nr:LysR family transcriptional regulator [Alphaproteobacteria bacterium]